LLEPAFIQLSSSPANLELKMSFSTAVPHSTAPRSNSATGISTESEFNPEWSPDLDPDDLRELQAAEQDPSKIVAKVPKESARLGYYSTLCLISNRMIGRSGSSQTKTGLLTVGLQIGSGIFTSASIVFLNTQSIGLSLILWVIGAIFALSVVIVFIELGLTIPRWPFGPNGEKMSTPRSGDALNYVCVHDKHTPDSKSNHDLF
jgi:hypothetical protein